MGLVQICTNSKLRYLNHFLWNKKYIHTILFIKYTQIEREMRRMVKESKPFKRGFREKIQKNYWQPRNQQKRWSKNFVIWWNEIGIFGVNFSQVPTFANCEHRIPMKEKSASRGIWLYIIPPSLPFKTESDTWSLLPNSMNPLKKKLNFILILGFKI